MFGNRPIYSRDCAKGKFNQLNITEKNTNVYVFDRTVMNKF